MLPVSVVCCQVEISVMGGSSVQWSLSQCGMSELDHTTLIISMLWHPRSYCATEEKWLP
jgi:hypothetical protein